MHVAVVENVEAAVTSADLVELVADFAGVAELAVVADALVVLGLELVPVPVPVPAPAVAFDVLAVRAAEPVAAADVAADFADAVVEFLEGGNWEALIYAVLVDRLAVLEHVVEDVAEDVSQEDIDVVGMAEVVAVQDGEAVAFAF